MRLRILGPLEATDDEGNELALGGPKQRAVLAILLLRAGEIVTSERLIDELWGESPPKSAPNTLQVYISNLRKALGEGVVVTRPGGYRLEPEAVELDAVEFDALLAAAGQAMRAGDAGGAHRLVVQGLALWRGPALTDFAYEPFAQGEIARLEEQRIVAIEERIDALLKMGGDAGLVGELEGLIREYPLRERLRGQLMLALYRSGRQADALETYRQGRELLIEELGLEPGAELRKLQEAILNQDPALLIMRRELADGEAPRRGRLPRRSRPLIGRDRELQDLAELLSDPAVGLVTLAGTGGIGKTTLALEAAREAGDRFPDGTTVVWLAELTDEGQVTNELARTLGATPNPGEAMLESLIRVLRGQERLLVIDNFEHVLGAAADIAALAHECERVKLLVTSRAPLRVSEERVYAVSPLAIPPADTAAVADSAAAALFLERATAGDPAYTLSTADEAGLAELCRYLGGVPLALELAAARATVLSPTAILERLRTSSEALGPAGRDAPERQRSLRATIEWSTRLISPEEQSLLARLSVFAGGFTAEAVEAVAADLELSVTDGLMTLLDHGLIHHVPGRHGTRLAMLEPIRDYARERLAEDPRQDTVLLAYAEHYATFAENAGAGFASHAQVHWIARTDDEQANLRAVTQTASSAALLEAALRIAGALAEYWIIRPLAIDFDGWLAPALEGYAGEPSVRAGALFALAIRSHSAGDLQRAADAFGEAAAIFERIGNRSLALVSEARLAWILHLLGSEEDAIAHRAHAQAALEREPNPIARATARDWLTWRGDATPEQVHASLAGYLDAATAAGDVMRQASISLSLGVQAMLAGDYPNARVRLEHALQFAQSTWEDTLDPPIQANLGQVALYEGDTEEARRQLIDAARGAVRLGEPEHLQEVLIGIAAAAAAEGDRGRAARLRAAAHSVYDGPMSEESKAMLERYLADIPEQPDAPRLQPGMIGARELEALIGEPDRLQRSPSVS